MSDFVAIEDDGHSPLDMGTFSTAVSAPTGAVDAETLDQAAAVRADHDFIRANLPEAAIISLTSQFLTMVLMRTAYSRVQLRILVTDNYPYECPIVGLQFMYLLSLQSHNCSLHVFSSTIHRLRSYSFLIKVIFSSLFICVLH